MSLVMTWKELEERIIVRAGQDESFKQALVSNPRSTLEKEGINLPSSIDVNLVEITPGNLSLQALPNSEQDTLSEAELESVAGGRISGEVSVSVKIKF